MQAALLHPEVQCQCTSQAFIFPRRLKFRNDFINFCKSENWLAEAGTMVEYLRLISCQDFRQN
jgi:hypothetical protein